MEPVLEAISFIDLNLCGTQVVSGSTHLLELTFSVNACLLRTQTFWAYLCASLYWLISLHLNTMRIDCKGFE